MTDDKMTKDVQLAENSARRMVSATKQPRDKVWFLFMRKESTILLKRAWSIWWRVRWRNGK